MHEETLFIEAMEIRDAAEQAAYLDRVCAGDAALRVRLERLLDEHRRAGSFLGHPAVAPGATRTFDPSPEVETTALPGEHVGTQIGPYRLLQQIGEGGMGTVYMAEQTQPVKRKVALKVIKAGMDSRQVVARFEAERQALAMMDHVNIARVLDAGTTESGRPYFVMELIHGIPITRYCDDNKLTPRERLELFVPVCQAIQHAHQKGIIHRDIKPSNIMVTLYDGKPVPKVIDFGIAKATEQKLTERTLFTQYGTLVGTLQYMSPEQAEMSALGIDTRSDIYSLGVLLYELLTGSTPLTHKRIKQATYGEILRIIKEEEPQKPSTRLSDSGDTLASISAQRHMAPAKLSKLVRGELDWIVMKTLEKDRNRRYETASALGTDVQRYLADEAVQACPPSVSYRLAKFARRHKVGLGVATLGLAVLVLAVVGLAVSNTLIRTETAAKETALEAKLRAESQRADEEQKRADAEGAKLRAESQRADEEQKRADAEKQRATALDKWRQTAHYLTLAQAFNEYRANNVVRAEEMLDKGAEDLRHWEWHYLKRLCHSELSSISVGSLGPRKGAFSLDARQVAVVTNDVNKSVLVYDAATGQEKQRLAIKGHFVIGVTFSPDGTRLATYGHDLGQPSVHLFDTQKGAELMVFKGLKQGNREMFGAASSPDGRRVAGTDRKGNLFVWDADSGKQLFHVVAHPGPDTKSDWILFTKPAFNQNGTLVATACEEDAAIKIWDVPSGKLVQSLAPGDGFSHVVFSAQGTWVAAAGKYLGVREPDLSVRIWNAKTGQTRHVLRGHTKPVLCLAFSPDEKLLATGSADSSLTLWDVATGREVGTYRGRASGVTALAFSADSKQVLSLSGDSVVKTWPATHGPEALALKCRGADHAAFSPDGRYVAAAANHATKKDWTGVVWDTATGEEVDGFGTASGEMLQLAYSPNGRFIAAAIADLGDNIGYVRIWDVAAGKFDHRFPDEKQELIGPCFAVAYSPDGKLLAAAGADRLVHVWDTTTRVEKFRLTGHPRSLTGLAFSRDSRRLASASGGLSWEVSPSGKNPLNLESDPRRGPDDVKVWDMDTGKELLALKLPQRPRGMALSPDGDVVAVTASDKTVRLYDVATGKETLVLRGHTQSPRAVAFSPDGKRIVTGGGSDRSVRLWDARTGEEILTFSPVADPVTGVAFSPDGHKIVATSQTDDVVKVWDATPVKRYAELQRLPLSSDTSHAVGVVVR